MTPPHWPRDESGRECLIDLRDVGVAYFLRKSVFSYRRFWALEDVSFQIFRGESMGIVGKNGAGKSTLLQLLAGVMSPDKGTVINYGASTSLLALNLGFMPYLTGRENAILGGLFQGSTRRHMETHMDEIIEFTGLDEFIDQPLYTYSSGMQARLGFAVAFQAKPDIFLIDEVFGVGDQDFQEKSKSLMKERLKSSDTTVLFVSHNEKLIQEVCERCVWIENRVARMAGPTQEVLERYNEYVAQQRAQQRH